MFHNSKTKGHGSIRKNKIYGTIGVLTLGTIAILSAHQGVAADEVKATKPTTPTPVAEASDTSLAAQSKAAATEAASSSTATTVKETTPAASTTTAPAGSTSTADNTTASAATKTESATKPATAKTETPAAAKPSAQTGTTTDVNVDSSELDKAVNDAKKAGVEVKKEADVNHGTATTEAEKNQKVAEIKDDYKKQAEEIKKVTEAAKSDTAKYTEAKAKYDAELAKYNTAKAIYDTAKAKYDTDKAKYDADKANYDINKAKFELDKAKYEQDLTKYYAAKEKYGKDFADYIVAQAKYEKDLQDYNAALAEWGKNKNNDGYIKQKLAQQLIFKSEPHARLSFPGGDKVYTKDELKRYFENHIKNKLGSNDPRDGVNDFNATNDASSLSRVMLRKGQPLVTQYTNLQNSYFKGKKIAKVEYVYTLKDSGTPGLDEIPAFIENDPTKTIWYMSLYGKNTRINMKAYFYDEDGNKMDMTGALVSFSSLNRGTGAYNASPKAANQATIEKVYSFSGDFIHINGSSIDRQYDGGAYSSNDNESIARGSKYNASQWDGQNAPYKWYGAIVGQVTSPDIELEFGSVLRATPWFAFNSDIKANGVPIMPVKPTKPEEPKEPTKPVAPVAPVAPTEPVKPTPPTAPEKPATRTATYHYNTLKYQTIPTPEKKYGDVTVEYKNKDGMTISPKVTDTPRSEVGTDYDTTDQRKETITTVDGKKYRLDPKATQGAETGKVVEGNTNITYYYDLVPDIPTPEKKYGDVTVEYKNKDGMTISPKVTDTPRSEVGTDYDTTDQRKETITTVDGKKYRLDPKATQGAETGKVVEGNTNITYYYDLVPDIPTPEKKYGDVTVEYKNKDGMTISPKVTDTPRSEVGTDYDTTDQRKETITTVDGKKYRLDPKATQGAETGKVVEGNTNITYYYDLVPDIPTPEKKYGDVTVEYKNKDGMTISPKVTDTPRSEVGTDYDTTDQRKETITTVDGKKYRLDPKATQGAETGKVVEGNTNITYYYDLVPDAPEEYGNVVVDYQDKKGNTIAPRVVDTPDSKVGTNYDTTDHKPTRITTADGKVYRIDPKATQGQESGKIVKGTTRVVYVYDEVVGDVTVHYKDEDGKVIKEPEKDTTGAPINTVYDTRDHAHKTITTKDGRTYEIVPEKTQGIEQGRVVEGNTDVTYIYKQVFGDVVVHYEDESGKKIKEDVTDTSHARVGEDYDTTDHKTTAIKSGDKIYNLVPEKTKGNEKGKVTKGVTEVTYVYKEVKAEPKKKGTNAKGEDVNGKTMLAGSTEVYTIDIDNDQYKGMTGLTDKDKQAGLMVVEKYSSKHVTPNLAGVRVTTEDGKVQSGFTTKIYKSVAEAPQKVQDYIKAKGLKIDGEFAVTTADDPVAYTNNYVLKGINLKLVFPTTVKKEIKEASKYDNRAYQIDFTGIHETNLVTNNIPKINPKKDVVATVEDGQKDQNSLNNKTVKVGQVYNFELETSYLPANRGQAIEKMEVRDKYSSLVEYNGVHKWYAKTDILLKNGQKLAKGTDLTQYVNQTIDHKARTVVYSFSSDFLSKISDNSEFQATGYMQVKQLNTGTVKNTFTEIINNVERDSNTVTVDSPQDYGDVVVHYVDESGKKIKEDVTDTSHSKVGENYDTTDHKTTAIKSGDKVYNLVPEKTKGNEKGKVTKGVTEVTYVYKEVKAEPKKKGTNAKGEDVNGKTMLAGSTEVYTIDIDNDQYKGMTGLTDKDKQAGLMVVEKYSGKYVTPNLAGVRVTTEDGKVQSGFTTKIYKSVAEAPQKVQDYIKAKGLKIDGEFAVTTADDPVAYTNNYVLKGINLKLVFPTTVKKEIKEASKYDNRAYQIDFTGIHETNLVTNNIPKINPKKDVVATVEDGQKDQNSLNNKTVKVGQVYNFELETSYLPANRGQAIEKMEVRDKYSSLVEYNGVHKWYAKTDILLKNGQKLAKGTDLTKFVNQTVDHKTRTVLYSFSSAFLNSISDNSEFQATGYMQVKQLDYGTVKNTFTEIINGVERNSNTVTVVTPDKPKTPDKPQTPPETPKTPEKPQTPPTPTPTPVVPTTPKQPVTPQVTLPSTGEATNDGAALVGLAFAATALSMLGFKKRKEEE
ncbi:hypothetical protein SA27298_0150 [Streptococcus anginosus]|uniref:SspB-related isopeptide-forming adhesin n=1 Tax=Streptococcus anginosus TaxID=1328 RepID=UPI00206E27E5|nr:SspB-related isopeptide-forming adhesin [Streptococcus anginosus]BBD41631.1 hypothetical protein SA27298_0150 [Streptococcus anginosus]